MARWYRDLTACAVWLCACSSPPQPQGSDASASVMQQPASLPPQTAAASAGAAAGAIAQQPARAGAPAVKPAQAAAAPSDGAPAAAGSMGVPAAGSGSAGMPAAGAAGAAGATTQAPSQLCAAMVAAAKDFISALDSDALKTAALHPFDQRRAFAYEPQVAARPGVPLSMLSDAQQQKLLALVHSGLSEEGFKKAETVRALENLKAVTGFQITMRDPKYYWLAVFGDPSETGEWGWQFEGHHLALHFTLKACMISDTPTFMGAWPAEVGSMAAGGPPVGSRNLEQEEDLGRVLAKSIDADPAKRMQAFQDSSYRQMLPEGSARATPMMPAGLAGSAMSDTERMQLKAIVSQYAGAMHPELASARLKRIEDHGGWEKVSFVWTGALEPKQRHFYRIQGESFFIEYRNDDGNHIHSAWRDFAGDWGDDLK
ncbi:MAG TPA: DUF3500 domain-containing protein [Polyangiales bacterium]|nr:DUF3500 domain-containing protein [Polyangiales bacterium]